MYKLDNKSSYDKRKCVIKQVHDLAESIGITIQLTDKKVRPRRFDHLIVTKITK